MYKVIYFLLFIIFLQGCWRHQVTLKETVLSGYKLHKNMTKEQVDSIGQGRVWSAKDAVEIGIVDEIGSIQDAIDEAAKLADIQDYKLIELPKVKNFMEQIFDNLETSIKMKKYGVLYDTYEQINNLQYLQGIQALMPYQIDIIE